MIILNNFIMLCFDKNVQFPWGVPKSIETLIHSYIPFPIFFRSHTLLHIDMCRFYGTTFESFIDFLIDYNKHSKMHAQKNALKNFLQTEMTSQLIINFNANNYKIQIFPFIFYICNYFVFQPILID